MGVDVDELEVRVASETSARLATLEGESVGVKKKKCRRRDAGALEGSAPRPQPLLVVLRGSAQLNVGGGPRRPEEAVERAAADAPTALATRTRPQGGQQPMRPLALFVIFERAPSRIP